MINKYTNQEAVKFLGYEPAYGYHTTIYETGDFQSSSFSVGVKEYRHQVSVEIKFFGHTPNGSAGPHGLVMAVPNPEQYNRSVSISNGENSVRSWVADCGTAQSFADKCFSLNK